MLTFLRKIRLRLIGLTPSDTAQSSLIESGSARRYILYAIGEIALVVLGILIALQINNWNEVRKAHIAEREFLNRLQDDLEFDLATFEGDKMYLETVYQSGLNALSFLTSNSKCIKDCDQVLVSLYNASQWTHLSARKTTYNEMPQTGFPNNRELKDHITQYYSFFLLMGPLTSPSDYRQHIRSFIPPEIQNTLFNTCHPTSNPRFAKVIEDCNPNIDEIQSREIINILQAHPETEHLLNYWMSTLITMLDALKGVNSEAEKMMLLIQEELDR